MKTGLNALESADKSMPYRIMQRFQWVGLDGLLVLLLSNMAIVATLGGSWLWQIRRVYRMASKASTELRGDELLLVLGMRLRDNTVNEDYASRLRRAYSLWVHRPTSHILLLGGKTGDSELSEAAAGKQFLIAQGVPAESIFLEDASRHTLENLQGARLLLRERKTQAIALITNRYHLERTRAFATGMGLVHSPCAAEDALPKNLKTWLRIFKEAYLVHWYHVGWAWSTWTRNQESLRRIS